MNELLAIAEAPAAYSELTQPADLGERLGLEREETVTALALLHPPAAGGDVEVRPVTTPEEFTTAQRIDVLAHGGTPDADEAAHAAAWERLRDTFLLWLAYVDGRPVGMGRAGRSQGALMLIGGATLQEARGCGVYRALVAARWEEAVRRGTPALVVAANDQSAPILRTLGFEELGTIRLFADRP